MASLERANDVRDGKRGYKRSVTILGITKNEDLPPAAIAAALRKSSKLGARERKIEEAERRVDH